MEELEDAGLIADDLVVVEEEDNEEDKSYVPPPRVDLKCRDNSVSVVMRQLIADGEHDPRIIITKLMAGTVAGQIKKTRNLHMVHGFLRKELMAIYKSPEITSWRGFESKILKCRFKQDDVAELGKDTGIPLFTPHWIKKKYRKAQASSSAS